MIYILALTALCASLTTVSAESQVVIEDVENPQPVILIEQPSENWLVRNSLYPGQTPRTNDHDHNVWLIAVIVVAVLLTIVMLIVVGLFVASTYGCC